MECKFLNHGLAIAYQDVVKPCCVWQFDNEFKNNHSLDKVDIKNWHQHPDVVQARTLLENNIWPKNCGYCKHHEDGVRQDSIRLGGNNSYANYSDDDITLEIRPGSVCNFACQTCWPAASSRVASYYNQINFVKDKKILLSSVDTEQTTTFKNFDFLLPVVDRIRSIVLLGGEPFYDKNCVNFLEWWNENSNAELLVFTNGSTLPIDFLNSCNKKLTLIFSIDATGRAAEYVRFGTDWNTVWNNFQTVKSMNKFNLRVNITQSVYNYVYLSDVIDLFVDQWPNLITFGPVSETHLNESVIPEQHREPIITKLSKSIDDLSQANIEHGQKHNAINALQSIINNLKSVSFDPVQNQKFKDFVKDMDRVKKINIGEYCPEVARYIA